MTVLEALSALIQNATSDAERRRLVGGVLRALGSEPVPATLLLRARWRAAPSAPPVSVAVWPETVAGPVALVGARVLDGRFLTVHDDDTLTWDARAARAARRVENNARHSAAARAEFDDALLHGKPRVKPRIAITAAQIRELQQTFGSVAAVARHLGVSRPVLDHRLAEAEGRPLPAMYRTSKRPGVSAKIAPKPLEAHHAARDLARQRRAASPEQPRKTTTG